MTHEQEGILDKSKLRYISQNNHCEVLKHCKVMKGKGRGTIFSKLKKD